MKSLSKKSYLINLLLFLTTLGIAQNPIEKKVGHLLLMMNLMIQYWIKPNGKLLFIGEEETTKTILFIMGKINLNFQTHPY